LSFSCSIIIPNVFEEIKRGDGIAAKTLFSPVIILVIGCKLESILIRLVWSRITALLSILMTHAKAKPIKQKTNP